MNKEDLIYDVVCEIREQNNKRFEQIEKDIKELYKFKNTILGYCGGVALLGSFIFNYFKDLLR